MRSKAFTISCLVALVATVSPAARATTLNYNLNYPLTGTFGGSNGTGEFAVPEIDKLFNNAVSPIDAYQQILDLMNSNSNSGPRSPDSPLVNGNPDSLLGPNSYLLVVGITPKNPSAFTTSDQTFTNGPVSELSLTQNSIGLSSGILNGSLALIVAPTSAKTFSGPKNSISSFVDNAITLPNLPLVGDSVLVDSGTVSAAPLPGALPLFATGLGGLGFLRWLRKRKAHPLKT